MRFLTSDSAEARLLLEDLAKALLVMREAGHDIKCIPEHIWDLRFMVRDSHLPYEVDRGRIDGWQYTIYLHSQYRDCALIERLELLLSAVLLAEDRYNTSLALCQQSVLSVNERWRLLQIIQPLQNLRIAKFEDRVRCAICHGIIATDAPTEETRFGSKVHYGCHVYLHNVMIPALKMQREAEAAKQNA